jgi:hypothetical protein
MSNACSMNWQTAWTSSDVCKMTRPPHRSVMRISGSGGSGSFGSTYTFRFRRIFSAKLATPLGRASTSASGASLTQACFSTALRKPS